MLILQTALEEQISQKSIKREDVISLVTYLAQLPVETLTDIESISNLLFHLESQLFEINFNNEFGNMLHNLRNDNYIMLSIDKKKSIKVFVREKFIFKILLFISLRFRKALFTQSTSSITFLQFILEEILDTISIVRPQSLHLVKLLDMILKKRGDVLTPTLSVLVLKTMTKVAYSPLTGFKHSGQNVSRIVLRSLPHNCKNYLCNFNNLPIKGIDLNDILKEFTQKEVRPFFSFINKQILKLFRNNTDSRDGSFYYEMITSFCTFEDFQAEIWPFYCPYLEEFEDGEFHQSLLKYWIPITVKHYKDEFYDFITSKDVDIYFKAHTLLEIRKKGFSKPQFNPADIMHFFNWEKTCSVALRMVCTFVSKKHYPEESSIYMVQFYLNNYSSFEFPADVLKYLKIFISQIFIVSHLTLAKSDQDLNPHSEFLNFVYQFCLCRISDPETCEVSAQLLKILWDIASGSSADLVTCYKIDLDCIYKVGGNLYFQKLQSSGFWGDTFFNSELIKKFDFLFGQKFYFSPKLVTVIKERYLDVVNCDFDLTTLLVQINELVCLQSSETIRIYTDLVIAYSKFRKKSFSTEIEKIFSIFNDTVENFDFEKMFTSVLILDILIVTKSYDNIDLVRVIDRSLCFVAKIINKKLDTGLNPKETKIFEAFINNTVECLITSKNDWPNFNKESIFNNLSKIITDSNLKRPVLLSVGAIHTLGSSMENSADREIKIKLLDRTLKSLYHNKQSGKIRRNPETRLVIHALCLSDKNLTKPFLVSSLNFLLEVLSYPLSPDLTLSSSLHSLEVLVSDNSIHQLTLPFILPIIQNCIQLFNKTNWIVRNADLQLLKSLIERFLGVSLDENIRPKTIEDLFILFPTLVPHFYEILSQNELSDSAVITLLFFTESQIVNSSFIGESLEGDFDKFRHLFVKIMQKYSNNLGFLAIRAFTSLCAIKNIPSVFSDIVFYIQRNFHRMRQNVFANLIKLLQELYQKYKLGLVQTDEIIINEALRNLIAYLKQFDSFYFNLLSLRLHSVNEVVVEVVSLNREINYEKRIWLNNYVPHLMRNVDPDRLSIFLERISCQIPEFLQVRILSIIVDRIDEINVAPIMKILILKLRELPDCSKFLIMSYAKTILLCSEIVELNCDLIAETRQDFQTDSIYKIFIYVFVLSHCDNKSDKDAQFVTKCVGKYFDAIGDDEILFDLSSSLIYLYKCSSIGDRYKVMKIAFYLLLNEQTGFEICKFISLLTKFHSSSVLINFASLCDLSKLSTWVGDKKLALKLLAEFYCYINDLPDEEASDTYYLIENDLSLPKRYVKAMLLKSLSDCK